MTDLKTRYAQHAAALGGNAAAAQRCPEHDLGSFECFTGALPGRTFVSADGVVARDGSGPWASFVQAGSPAEVADRIAKMMSDTMTMSLSPTLPRPAHVQEREWATVGAPALQTLPQGSGTEFTAWFPNPPAFAPWRLTVRAETGRQVVVTQDPVGKFLAPVDQTEGYLKALETATGHGQRQAAEWLGNQKEPRAVPGLMKIVQSSGWGDARQAAAKAPGQIGAKEAIPAIRDAALAEKDAWALSDYLGAIGAIGGAEGREALVVIRDTHPLPNVRERARYELGNLP